MLDLHHIVTIFFNSYNLWPDLLEKLHNCSVLEG
ncbi:unnamed protein product [Ixodes pacificus]